MVYTAKVTSKGQITVPVEIREHLGLGPADKLRFIITDDGTVEVERSKYPNLMSLEGAAGSLPEPLPWDEVIRIAREDALLDEYDDSVE